MSDSAGSSGLWVCPAHGLEMDERWDRIACPAGHDYLKRNGIPRFVDGDRYASSFGSQWQRYRRTQLDSYTNTTITRDRARRCIGPDLWGRLSQSRVLEVGCGAGRFTEVLLGEGAEVWSLDLSAAVDVNAESFPIDARHRVLQADATAIPLRPRSFDLVFCLGVLQHTPSPEATAFSIAQFARPGGAVVFDIYRWTWRWYTRTAPLYRSWLRRASAGDALAATERLVERWYPLHERCRKYRFLEVLLNRISPIVYYGRAYPELAPALQREWSLLDTHDSLTDFYKNWRTPAQTRRLLQGLGLEGVWCSLGGNGIEARGLVPGPGAP